MLLISSIFAALLITIGFVIKLYRWMLKIYPDICECLTILKGAIPALFYQAHYDKDHPQYDSNHQGDYRNDELLPGTF